ncbi:MAG TPA: tetratricopeptide repeat protein, partial [Elusimicrobiales bacterium]|nr:tetratricopeptide repeat protein [Elusimicrobiales bacterium]
CGVLANDASEADTLYREGRFEQVIDIYRGLADKNPQNPYYHYNLGNCYYKTNQLGKAVASFYRAFNLLPRNRDIKQNLSMTLELTGQNLVWKGVPSVFHSAYFYLSLGELKGFFWLCFWLLTLCAGIFLLKQSLRNTLKTYLIMLAAITLAIGLWAGSRHLNSKNKLAVVINSSAVIKSGPGDNFGSLASISEGKLVEILGLKDNWYEVGIKNRSLKGWMEKSLLEVI